MTSPNSFSLPEDIYVSTPSVETQQHWHTLSNEGLETPPSEDVNSTWLDAIQLQVPLSLSLSTKPTVAVIGVGYVGFHLVQSFGKHYNVIAFDVSPLRLKTIAPQMEHLQSVVLTSDPSFLTRATHFLISVPTLLKSDKQIDTSYLRAAIGTVKTFARPRVTVVIESSVAVGMTRQLLGPLIESHGILAGMSPERVDPGRVHPPVHSIPKIISGLDDLAPGSLKSISKLYSKIFSSVVEVSSPEVAEMTKLYENCQRMVCIAYANEMADACLAHGIDPYEVSSAAATKPFGFTPYTPSLGIGGHCIPVNPYYLLSNSSFPILQAATEAMWTRPARIGHRIMTQLASSSNLLEHKSRRTRALVVGVGFKRGQSTLSNSPGIELINHLLGEWDADVTFADPLVGQESLEYVPRLDETMEWTKGELEKFDVIFGAVEQVGLDWDLLDKLDGVVVERYWDCKMNTRG